MDVEEAIKTRRSTRVYLDKEIPKEAIHKIIDAAQWAPNACNKQAWRFVIIDDNNLKKRLFTEGRAGHLVGIAPLVILVAYQKKISISKSSNIQSAAAAIQNALLMAHSLGIGGAWVTSTGSDEITMKILGIPKSYVVIAYLCLGYPKVQSKGPSRKNVEDIISYNRFYFGDYSEHLTTHNPKKWNLKQIVKFRGDSIWAYSPLPDAYLNIEKELKQEISIVSLLIKSSDKVLEVLPFAGTQTLHLLKTKPIDDYTIFEFSDSNARFIKERKESMKITQDINTIINNEILIKAENNTYDVVYCAQKLEEVPDKDKLLKEINRVLKPNGRLIISFRNMTSFNFIHYLVYYKLGLKYYEVKNSGPFKPIHYPLCKNIISKYFKIKSSHGITFSPKNMGKRVNILKPFSRIVVFECVKK